MSTLQIPTARVFRPLLAPARYKAAHGGRGSGKSHFFAEALIERCVMGPTRWACIREVQNSLKDSVRQLLIDKIQALGVGSLFDPLEAEIRGPHGSLIIFKGMHSYNAETIKSLEGFDGAWVEEAQTLSDHSLSILRPTIRKEGSELWFSWNPRHDDDAVDLFFRGAGRPAEAIAVRANWNDNPWFPAVLRQDKDRDYATDPERAEHVWGGGYLIVSEGSYYAKLLFASEKDGRVGHFPHDPARLVDTAWDLGVDDYSAIWFVQNDGRAATVIDYYEASGDGAEQLVRAALPELVPDPPAAAATMIEIGRFLPYRYGRHYLPHDVGNREWGAGAKSRTQTLTELGVKPILKGVRQGPAERINAVRRLLPIVRFHNTARVQVGLNRLRRYSRKWNSSMKTFTEPLHDENSHGADAFGEYAVNCGLVPDKVVMAATVPMAGQVMLPPPPMGRSGSRIRI